MAHFSHHSEENYLKTLFKLSQKPIRKLNNISLAKSLELNPATVLEMVRKLSQKNLVQVLPDKTIQLTEKGRKQAVMTIRKHRLWEVFLVEKLKYKWNEVHELAEQLEHVESSDLIDRLESYLGFPPCDPHGDPIPDKNGKIKQNISVPLNSGNKGKNYIVVNFAETDDQFLDYLNFMNIKPGTRIRITGLNEYDQSLNIMINRKPFQLTEKVAHNILVHPA